MRSRIHSFGRGTKSDGKNRLGRTTPQRSSLGHSAAELLPRKDIAANLCRDRVLSGQPHENGQQNDHCREIACVHQGYLRPLGATFSRSN